MSEIAFDDGSYFPIELNIYYSGRLPKYDIRKLLLLG